MAIKLMIVEDEALYRDMLTRVLSADPAINIVATAADGATAIQTARRAAPDVILMDIDLGEGPTGIEAGRRIKKARPSVGIVLLSMYSDKEYLSSLTPQEAAGWSYLLKSSVSDVETLTRAIEGAAAGFTVLDPAIVMALQPSPNTPLWSLTARQQEVMELMSQGHNNAAVATKLGIAEKSVENYINAIYQRLGVKLGVNMDDPVNPRVKAVIAYLEQSRHK
jgi:DNA-binding NarL/FixJ family response regulator